MNSKYIHEETVHNLDSPNEIAPILIDLFHPQSVLDVGCGIGTWVNTFKRLGVNIVAGIDGDYVNRELLTKYMSEDVFISHDLALPFDLQRNFDMVISLEVAEHLPYESAGGFVESLTKHGDIILFSAAIPGQGGQNHLNEQNYEFWIDLFAKFGFEVSDPIRNLIWNNTKVDYWYKQNILCFIKEGSINKPSKVTVLQTRHPDVFQVRITKLESDLTHLESGKSGILNSFKILWRAIVSKF